MLTFRNCFLLATCIFRFAMPHKPLRELKPELFADEKEKLEMLAVEDPESDDDMLQEEAEDDADADEDVSLLQSSDDNMEDEMIEEMVELNDDIPLTRSRRARD